MTMSEDERERVRLRYIFDSIVRIEQYTRGNPNAFLIEPMVQDAVLRRLETLAEATGKLSDALKARHPEIPWREVYGFRNIAAHGYRSCAIAGTRGGRRRRIGTLDLTVICGAGPT